MEIRIRPLGMCGKRDFSTGTQVPKAVLLNRAGVCPLGDTGPYVEVVLVVKMWGGRVLQQSSGWGPGLLLNVLQCTGRPHSRERWRPKCPLSCPKC